MSDSKKPITKIEDSELWRTVANIAREAYNIYGSLSDDSWSLRNKFETGALDVTSDVAEACGSLDPRDVKYSLSRARKDLFLLKNAYSLAFHTGLIEVKPEVMVEIDKAVELVDKEVVALAQDFKQWREEMTDWKTEHHEN